MFTGSTVPAHQGSSVVRKSVRKATFRWGAGCIAQVAMRETVKLTQFLDMKEERRVIEEDSYINDLLTSHCDSHCLDKILEGVEKILRAGGF